MPLKKLKTKALLRKQKNEAFLPILLLTFLLWLFYRSIFHFPVWFDESLGKLIFFALPVLWYLALSNDRRILASFALPKLKPGLLLGLAIGGVFGFAATFLGALNHQMTINFLPYYLAEWFWLEFFLALLTGFWETLFFFSFVMQVIEEKFHYWSLLKQILCTAAIFLLFHLPNILLRFESAQNVILQILLLFTFACGQALLFYQKRNAYLLLMVQAIWGMALLIHF